MLSAWCTSLDNLHLGALEAEVLLQLSLLLEDLDRHLDGQKARKAATLESNAASSSAWGSGWAPGGLAWYPGSAVPPRAARRALRSEEPQEPSWGTAEGGTLTMLGHLVARAAVLCEPHLCIGLQPPSRRVTASITWTWGDSLRRIGLQPPSRRVAARAGVLWCEPHRAEGAAAQHVPDAKGRVDVQGYAWLGGVVSGRSRQHREHRRCMASAASARR